MRLSRIFLLVSGAMIACATDASNTDESDAGDNGPSYADQYVSHSDGGLDSTIPPDQDVFVPPPDDTGPPPDANGGCGAVGTPCDPNNAFSCGLPLFFQCANVLNGLDAGVPDGGGSDAGDGGDAADADAGPPPPPPLPGVCLPAFEVTFGMQPCNNGTDHCPAGSTCLLASQLCIAAADNACICTNPVYAPGCGPP